MNEPPDSEPRTGLQESFATEEPTAQSTYTFEWPEDKEGSTLKIGLAETQSRQQHFWSWAFFWLVTWGGTTLAGGLFGGALATIGIMDFIAAPFLGLLYGSIWAGGVGLFIFFHLGAICWIFWWHGQPIVIATVAGLLVGLFCGLFVFSIITGPMGAFGAYLAGSQFFKSREGQKFQATIELSKSKSSGRLRFTTTDLLLRMTVISVMIAGWTAFIQAN